MRSATLSGRTVNRHGSCSPMRTAALPSVGSGCGSSTGSALSARAAGRDRRARRPSTQCSDERVGPCIMGCCDTCARHQSQYGRSGSACRTRLFFAEGPPGSSPNARTMAPTGVCPISRGELPDLHRSSKNSMPWERRPPHWVRTRGSDSSRVSAPGLRYSYCAISPGWIPSERSKLAPTAPTTAVFRSSPIRLRNR